MSLKENFWIAIIAIVAGMGFQDTANNIFDKHFPT